MNIDFPCADIGRTKGWGGGPIIGNKSLRMLQEIGGFIGMGALRSFIYYKDVIEEMDKIVERIDSELVLLPGHSSNLSFPVTVNFAKVVSSKPNTALGLAHLSFLFSASDY